MTATRERWTLGAKLAAVGLPFLLAGLLTTALTLWVSWQLDGGAAAVNEAGRLRMQTYRLAWATTAAGDSAAPRDALVAQLDASLKLLQAGDTERPLVMPWDADVRRHFDAVQAAWQVLRKTHLDHLAATPPHDVLDRATARLVQDIDALVSAMESHLSRYTSLLHLLQVGLLVLGTLASSVLVVVGYHFVLEPVLDLRRAVGALQGGDLAARAELGGSDELGALAAGFNDMAEQLQASYADLEGRVREKTAELQEKRERLQALYDVSLLVSTASGLQELADGFTRRVREAVRADAAALRFAKAGASQFLMLASDGVPANILDNEHCLKPGDCHCGASTVAGHTGARVIPIQRPPGDTPLHCEQMGWATMVALPIRTHQHLLGELNLFFHAEVSLGEADRAMLDTLTTHLASGMENLRLRSLEREAAAAEERAFLARELHDSIAQSLAFLNIQAQLMRQAMASGNPQRMAQALSEIELGLRESHGDVRELLVHFRTRTNDEDIEHALLATLKKFEHQSGMAGALSVHGDGLPLPADAQIQALHIVQEALSNVRKHSRASQVWIDVWKQPQWAIRVRDDGRGFIPAAGIDETHVGLRIMRERAQRLGAELRLESEPGEGTSVTLTLPAPVHDERGAAAIADAPSESAST